MKSFIMDKLYKRIEERGVVCLGLDTAVEYIPSHILDGKSIEEAIFEYNKSIIVISTALQVISFKAAF